MCARLSKAWLLQSSSQSPLAFPDMLLGCFLVLWASTRPRPCWLPAPGLLSCPSSVMILMVGIFRGCHLAHAPPRGVFVMRHLPSPLYPQFKHSTIFPGRRATGSFRHVHSQSVTCSFFSCPVTLIPAENPNLWDTEQSWAEFRRQEKPAFQILLSFFFKTNHFIFSFSIPWD